MQDRHVSRLYAQLGYPQASREQSSLVPAASARFETEIEWRLVSAHRGLQRGEVLEVKRLLGEVEDHLDRGIGCGALADPWNIIGFQGMFPLFSSREDVVPDQRIADLIEIVESLFGIYSLALGEAAAVSDPETFASLSSAFERRAAVVGQVRRLDRRGFAESPGPGKLAVGRRASLPRSVRGARRAKRRAIFRFGGRTSSTSNPSSRTRLVVDVLLRRRDYVAAMGLLIQWLSNSEKRRARGGRLFVPDPVDPLDAGNPGVGRTTGTPANDSWPAMRRLFDFLEANAGSYWTVPTLAEAEGGVTKARASESPTSNADEEGPLEEETASDEESLFEAAYEGVVYRDSTRDGREGDTLESGPNRETAEVDALTRFFEPRLRFINTLAQAWLMAALRFRRRTARRGPARGKSAEPSREEVIAGWRRKAADRCPATCRDSPTNSRNTRSSSPRATTTRTWNTITSATPSFTSCTPSCSRRSACEWPSGF